MRLADDGAFEVIAHGCNCFCTMGAGIAKCVAARFPQALEAGRQTSKGERFETPHGRLTVVNAYTQFHYRDRGDKADYEVAGLGLLYCMNIYQINITKADTCL